MIETKIVGERLAALRKDRKLSSGELSERSGISESEIEAIEASRVSPGIAPLVKLSRALGVRLGTFLDDVSGVGPIVSRAGGASEVMRAPGQVSANKGAMSFFSLAQGKKDRSMEPLIVDIRPSQGAEPPASTHEGEEFVYVLEGAVKIRYGSETIKLGVGDSVYYDSIVPHLVSSEASARILAVVYAPF
jgi:transcriptional regulator with XRE-family HTH domain